MAYKSIVSVVFLLLFTQIDISTSSNLNQPHFAISATPPSSDFVISNSYSIDLGALVIDVIDHNQSFFVLVSHSGSGMIGSQTWSGIPTSHALIEIEENGTVNQPLHFTSYDSSKIYSTNHGILIVSNQSGYPHFSILDVTTQQFSNHSFQGSGDGPYQLLASDASASKIVFTTRCYVTATASADFFGDDCSTTDSRFQLMTYSLDLSTGIFSQLSTSGWFRTFDFTTEIGGSTGSTVETIGPHPSCEQFLQVLEDGSVNSLAQMDCGPTADWNRATNVDQSTSLFGSTSGWSPNDFSSWGLGITASHMDANGQEYYAGWIFGTEDCSQANMMNANVEHMGSTLLIHVLGWTSGNNGLQCSLNTHEQASSGNSYEIVKQKWSGREAILLGDRNLNASSVEFITTQRDIERLSGVSVEDESYVSICHSGSLQTLQSSIVSGGVLPQNTIIGWKNGGITNTTVVSANAGCISSMAFMQSSLILLIEDGAIQELHLLGSDSDGDGYAINEDIFPNDSNQWSDQDGDGYGDNPGFANSDDCVLAFGNSSEGKRGCLDTDGDMWADLVDAFTTDPTQWNDSDGDGFGDNSSGTFGDACPSQSGSSTIDRYGCPDQDFDGFSDTGDRYPANPSQWNDSDDDGFGDNPSGTDGDDCPSIPGNSTIEILGCPDSDGDYYADIIDALPYDSTQHKDLDGDGYGDNPNGTQPDAFRFDPTQHADSDGDGYGDNPGGSRGDSCPEQWGNSSVDVYGCIDTDGDGYSDIGDGFPNDPLRWIDTDRDGVEDTFDAFPYDPTQDTDLDNDTYGDNPAGNRGDECPNEWGNSTSDRYGCPDADGDGISDQGDGFPNDPTRWIDTDGDGFEDKEDDFPFNPTQWVDTDGDGFGDNKFGSNGDKFPLDETQWSDIDGDGYGDNITGNASDSFLADPSQWSDMDGDGCGDNLAGRNPDYFPNDITQCEDADGDGFGDNLSGNNPDPFLFDQDNDGYNDSIDVLPLLASPGDLDNDGILDENDIFPADYREYKDSDNDGVGDNADLDDDNDGWTDTDEIRLNTDPYSSSSYPVESFEFVVPGTTIGLGAWDVIGVFVGLPLTIWVMFGFVTRGGRARKYESELRDATKREELEDIALKYERSVMFRMLGPHQAIRLERLRTELDDIIESRINEELIAASAAYPYQQEVTQEYLQQQQAYQKSYPEIYPQQGQRP